MKKRHPDKNIIPAGILYYNIDNPIIEVQSMPNEEDADYREAVDEMILENLRMKGVVNEDTEIIRKMDDRGGKSAVIPVAFKSNGELDMRSHIYSTQKFEQLTDYVTEKSADMAAGILVEMWTLIRTTRRRKMPVPIVRTMRYAVFHRIFREGSPAA